MLQIEMKPVSLLKLINEVCQEAKPEVSAKNLDFSVNFQDNVPPLVLTDPMRLRQLLLNIINNAVILSTRGAIQIHCTIKRPATKYDFAAAAAASASDGDAAITLEATHPFSAVTMVQVDVIATGAVFSSHLRHSSGIAMNLEDSLLLDTNRDGLGLSIGQRLADLMDGEISVSGVPGSGTKFSLLLNVYVPFDSQTENALVQAFNVSPVQGSQLEPGLNIRPPDKLAREKQDQNQGGQLLQNTRILVVDDVTVNQLAMTTQLRNAGAIVDVSNNGSAAVKKINDNADNGIFYDIILMDVQMPVMDGFQATTVLRQQGSMVPVVAVTARAEDVERSIEAGCNGYIFKPVFTDTLISTIQKYLK
jgi:CheY-like chemotaxis protein